MTPYLDFWNGTDQYTRAQSGWQGTGGTSGAAPVWAALFALADASQSCRGTLVGDADPALYALAGQSLTSYFNDITLGNNDFTPSGNSSGLYPAAAGYDLASGLGTPKASALVPGLCAQAVRLSYPGSVYTFYGQHVRLKLQATLAAGQTGALSFRALRLPLGLHIDRATGVISGTVRRAGVRTVTVSATTASGSRGAIRFSWTVERRPRVIARLGGTRTAPNLTIRARSGAFEPGLSKVVIALPQSISLAQGTALVQVLNPAGGSVADTVRYADHVVTIHLAVPQSPLRVVFPAGSLRVRPGLSGPVSVSVGTVDRLGGHLVLRRSLGRV